MYSTSQTYSKEEVYNKEQADSAITQNTAFKNISSLFTYNENYVSSIVAYANNNIVYCRIMCKPGVPDQANIASVPASYKPLLRTSFSTFAMNGSDLDSGFCGLIYENSQSIQVRMGKVTTGSGGVLISASWPYK